MSEPAKPETKKRAGRGWLYASLALNLVLIGLIAGAVAAQGRHARGMDEGRLWAQIAEDDRRAVGRATFQAAREARPVLRQIRDARSAAIAAARAEPFDPAAFEAALGEVQTLEAEARETFMRRLAQLMPDVSPDTRAAIASRILRPGPEGRGERRPPPGGLQDRPPPD